MHFLRSIMRAAFAVAVLSVSLAMPASASVPPDPGFHAMKPMEGSYSAPITQAADHAGLTCEAPVDTFRVFTRSIVCTGAFHIASSDGTVPRFLDLRRRC